MEILGLLTPALASISISTSTSSTPVPSPPATQQGASWPFNTLLLVSITLNGFTSSSFASVCHHTPPPSLAMEHHSIEGTRKQANWDLTLQKACAVTRCHHAAAFPAVVAVGFDVALAMHTGHGLGFQFRSGGEADTGEEEPAVLHEEEARLLLQGSITDRRFSIDSHRQMEMRGNDKPCKHHRVAGSGQKKRDRGGRSDGACRQACWRRGRGGRSCRIAQLRPRSRTPTRPLQCRPRTAPSYLLLLLLLRRRKRWVH
ncbi:hypothetical protein B296_00006792 [Ensete ventricosum]|uniref:Uncharacterized protein n=1 Tax=Ensete ventricosum TaxID=4639 RepID=A0A426ZXB9_ENSVE|nr:hypothetical protein B296_00006792 [Ensete ventricosum]